MHEIDPLEKAQKLFKRAYELQMKGKLDEAIENYQLSIQTYPTAEAHTFLGWTYSFKGDYELAIEECKKAIEVDRDFGNPYNDIGVYLIALGNYEEAVYWLEQAINAKRYESRHLPYYNLGRIMEKKSEWQEAIGYYSKALEIKPDYKPARESLTRLISWMN
ncbi:MAG: tetratricopeptide repeat protein [Ignavibacteria bacterium]|nr:tetratricopeptide repeat protein [Ignavibacteria bacterium]